ncbi:uncharacterized protein JCM6883_002086 [Sporobolomyces salmoneus]|uniref:uncharacterized protein n=1 Tax=Sporobolomyces salmoneus TaxID=183962 RepID=UPI0031764CFD
MPRTRGQAVPGGFEPLKGLKWTVRTEVDLINQLVQNREQLFAKHRRIVNPEAETESRKIVEALVESNSSFRSPFDRYS